MAAAAVPALVAAEEEAGEEEDEPGEAVLMGRVVAESWTAA